MNRGQSLMVADKVEDAVRILTHWLIQAMPGLDGDNRRDLHAEMRDVVPTIIDAAVITAVQHEQRSLAPLKAEA